MDFRLTADPVRGESFGRQASIANYFTGEDAANIQKNLPGPDELGRKKIDRHTTGTST
ncbi:MAG: hypothetical protein Q7S97_05270 [Polaromonas sp.]|nr:hypothetical protein [Polaromonas sp.]